MIDLANGLMEKCNLVIYRINQHLKNSGDEARIPEELAFMLEPMEVPPLLDRSASGHFLEYPHVGRNARYSPVQRATRLVRWIGASWRYVRTKLDIEEEGLGEEENAGGRLAEQFGLVREDAEDLRDHGQGARRPDGRRARPRAQVARGPLQSPVLPHPPERLRSSRHVQGAPVPRPAGRPGLGGLPSLHHPVPVRPDRVRNAAAGLMEHDVVRRERRGIRPPARGSRRLRGPAPRRGYEQRDPSVSPDCWRNGRASSMPRVRRRLSTSSPSPCSTACSARFRPTSCSFPWPSGGFIPSGPSAPGGTSGSTRDSSKSSWRRP